MYLLAARVSLLHEEVRLPRQGLCKIDEENAAYTALQNWRSKIVSGTTSPGEHRVKVSELWDDVVAEYHALQRRDTDGAIRRWNRNLKPFFGNMRATDVTDEKVRVRA